MRIERKVGKRNIWKNIGTILYIVTILVSFIMIVSTGSAGKDSSIEEGYEPVNPKYLSDEDVQMLENNGLGSEQLSTIDKESLIKAGFDSVNPLPVDTTQRADKTGVKSVLSDKNTLPPKVDNSLREALDNYDLTFTTGGHAYWYLDNTIYYFGYDAARSGSIMNNQESWMYTTVTGPGTVRFLWSVSSEANYDYLEFYIDGMLKNRISGYIPWQQQSYYISASGSHTLKWRYVKDGSVSVGNDAGYVDKLEYYSPWIPIGDAVDNNYLTFNGWIGQNMRYYNSGDAARSLTHIHNQADSMYTTVTGPGTVRFLWSVSSEVNYDYLEFYVDGILQNRISGYVPWQQQCYYISTSGSHTLTWRYMKDGSVHVGEDAGWVDNVEYYSPWIPIGNAVGYPFTFTTGSTTGISCANWVGQYVKQYDGASARSGTIMENQDTWTQTSVAGPGTVKFWWSVSSEANYDYLEFYIDGTLKDRISGEIGWQQRSYNVDTGTHYLTWQYRKDGSVVVGSDAGWIDKLEFYEPSLTVLSPNGGENWVRGATYTISWLHGGYPEHFVSIELLKNNALYSTITSSTSNTGSYNWVIPSTQTLGSDYKIRINNNNNGQTDTSDNSFTISSPPTPSTYISITSPNGGENWARGTTRTISWTSSGNIGPYVKIELFKSGALKRVISPSTSNSGSFSWTVPSIQTPGNDYKIKITSKSNSAYYDWSDNYFIIS